MPQNHIACDQSEVIDFLGEKSSYTDNPNQVETIETHGAIIFLAGDNVYKMKKAVKFSYMDFSTLELREEICLHEIAVNKPAAPSIYLDAVPVTREISGDLLLNGSGTPVEWLVHMRRFPQENVLSNLAANNQLSLELTRKLAQSIANYHSSCVTKHHIDGYAYISSLLDNLNEAFTQASDLFTDNATSFSSRARALLQENQSLLSQRSKQGFIRRCHGDLHLQNIVNIEGTPVLFDAIEFDEKLATIDIFFDLAFLLMDLTKRGYNSAANITLNRYLQFTHSNINLEGLKILPLFLACRAGIRAMVLSQQAAQQPDSLHSATAIEARSYMQAALEYLEPTPPGLVAVGGLSGTGKSTLASALAPVIANPPGALHLRSDLERKTMFELEETERLPSVLYSPEISEKVYKTMLQKTEIALKAGHTVVVDAVFKEPEKRLAFEQLAKSLNIPFSGLWLTAPEQTLLDRVSHRKNDASDADETIVKKQQNEDTGPITWNIVEAGGTQTDTIIEANAKLSEQT